MKLTYDQAMDATRTFNGVCMARGSNDYKTYLLGNWSYYLNNEGRSLKIHIEAMSQEEAKDLVERIHLFWFQTPHGKDLPGRENFVILGDERVLEVGLITEKEAEGLDLQPVLYDEELF